MGEIISFFNETPDFESLVDEIEFLVPKYLGAVDALEASKDLEEICYSIDRINALWSRLGFLLHEVIKWETHIPVQAILEQCLQAEINVLEKIYLPLHEKIHCGPKFWSEELWESSRKVLLRMDEALEGMDFPSSHPDRQWISMTLNSQPRPASS